MIGGGQEGRRAGDCFADRYEIIGPLGQGGMGRVFMAHDLVLERTVALKVLREDLARSEEFVSRFRREAQAAASLSHENVVRVFDAGYGDDGTFYISMEYVAGGTLQDRLRREGALPHAEAARIAASVALALAAAHEGGIVHRDVKPHNVFLTERGDVKVGDFGIARATNATALTQTSLVLGTACYISPEVAEGLPATPKSDLYSLGVVLYEMLAGEPPFEAENPIALAVRHLNEEPPPLGVLAPGVPEALERETMRLLAKDPAYRPRSALAAADEIEDAAEGGAPATATTIPAGAGRTRRMPTAPPRGARSARAVAPRGARPARRFRRGLAAGLLFAGLLTAVAVPTALARLGEDVRLPWGDAAVAVPELSSSEVASGPLEAPDVPKGEPPAPPEREAPAPREEGPLPEPAPAPEEQYVQYAAPESEAPALREKQYDPAPVPEPDPRPEPSPVPVPEREAAPQEDEPPAPPEQKPEPEVIEAPPRTEEGPSGGGARGPEAPSPERVSPAPDVSLPPEAGEIVERVREDVEEGVEDPDAIVERVQEDLEEDLEGVAPGFSFGADGDPARGAGRR